MEHWGPFLETLLWVALIVGITWRFHKPMHALLEAITDRIKGGSDVTLGPVSFKSISAPEQAERANREIEKANAAAQAALPPPDPERHEHAQIPKPTLPPVPTPSATPQFRAMHFQAEDLALRAVQAEFGQPISRQVTSGRDEGFDGAFVLNNRLNIVEVKYVSRPPSLAVFQDTYSQIQSFIERNMLKSVNAILVAVVDQHQHIDATLQQLHSVANNSAFPVVVRVYALDDLQAKFGIVDAG